MAHDTGLVDDFTSQLLGSTSVSTQVPFTNLDSTRAAVIVNERPGTALPSMSVTIASMSIGSPSRTNCRVLRIPTYSVDGCTSSSTFEAKLWRFTSVTEALAETITGRSGFW